MRSRVRMSLCALLSCVVIAGGVRAGEAPAAAGADLEEKRAADLLSKGDLHYQVREFDEALEIYRNVIDRFPKSKARYTAHLKLGKHFCEKKEYETALDHLHRCAEGSTNPLEIAEALYLKGLCFYERKEYAKAFSEFRRVTSEYPGSEFANKSYFYIGMGHFYLKHYKPAIEAFQMVGTSISEQDPAIKKLTPGQRLFIKVNDKDLSVLSRQKKALKVEVKAKSGDKEVVELQPRGLEGIEFIGSVKTELGEPKPDSGTLEVLGNDQVEVTYIDTHASNKKRDVPRVCSISMACDGVVDFVDGIYKDRVQGVSISKQANIRVVDYDCDLSKAQDKVKVVVRSKTEIPPTEEERAKAAAEGVELEKKYDIKDEVALELAELQYIPGESPEEKAEAAKAEARAAEAAKDEGKPETKKKEEAKSEAPKAEAPKEAPKAEAPKPEAPVEPIYHTGIFVGSVLVAEGTPNKADNIIQAEQSDVLEVEYVDGLRVTSEKPETLKAEVTAFKGDISPPTPIGQNTAEAMKVRVQLQVADALMNMGRIYKELGLKKQATERFEEALKECFRVAREATQDKELQEQCQFLLWKIYFEKEDYQTAASMCLALLQNQKSEYADDALMMMGDMAAKKEKYTEAISYYQRLIAFVGGGQQAQPAQKGKGDEKKQPEKKVALSPLAPEAQYKIAQCYEKMAELQPSYKEQALMTYKALLENFPNCKWAPDAITNIANYYYSIKDYTRAAEIYEKARRDYADAEFLDSILLGYGKCLVRLKKKEEAKEVFYSIIEQFPESKHIPSVEKYLKLLRGKGGEKTTESDEGKKGEGAG